MGAPDAVVGACSSSTTVEDVEFVKVAAVEVDPCGLQDDRCIKVGDLHFKIVAVGESDGIKLKGVTAPGLHAI
jgi:hypothetical protein